MPDIPREAALDKAELYKKLGIIWTPADNASVEEINELHQHFPDVTPESILGIFEHCLKQNSATGCYHQIFWHFLNSKPPVAAEFKMASYDVSKMYPGKNGPEQVLLRKLINSLSKYAAFMQKHLFSRITDIDRTKIVPDFQKAIRTTEDYLSPKLRPEMFKKMMEKVREKCRDMSQSSTQFFHWIFWHMLNMQPELAKEFAKVQFSSDRMFPGDSSGRQDRQFVRGLGLYCQYSQIHFFSKQSGIDADKIPMEFQPVIRNVEEGFPGFDYQKIKKEFEKKDQSTSSRHDAVFWGILHTAPELEKEFIKVRFNSQKMFEGDKSREKDRKLVASLSDYCGLIQRYYFCQETGSNFEKMKKALYPDFRRNEEVVTFSDKKTKLQWLLRLIYTKCRTSKSSAETKEIIKDELKGFLKKDASLTAIDKRILFGLYRRGVLDFFKQEYAKDPNHKNNLDLQERIEMLKTDPEEILYDDERDQDRSVRKFRYEVELIGPEKHAGIMKNLEIHGDDYKGKKLTPEILRAEGLLPLYKIKINGQSVGISAPYDLDASRVAVLGYVAVNGKLIARTFYLSNSHGIWKIISHYEVDGSGGVGWYGKGIGQDSIVLPLELQAALSTLTKKDSKLLRPKDPEFIFGGTARKRDEKASYFINTPMAQRLSGNFFEELRGGKYVKPRPETMVFSDPRESPDFSKRVARWEQYSKMYGNIIVEIFPSKHGHFRYMFCCDARGRAWIGNVEAEGKILPTGVKEKFVTGGALQTPAYDYESETEFQYVNDDDRYAANAFHDYVDTFQKYLSKIPVMKEYLAFVEKEKKAGRK